MAGKLFNKKYSYLRVSGVFHSYLSILFEALKKRIVIGNDFQSVSSENNHNDQQHKLLLLFIKKTYNKTNHLFEYAL